MEFSLSKRTLLDMVQDILSAMSSDEINSINDTVEALQVATIIKNVYYEMATNRNWPHQRRLMQLDAVSDLTHPNYLRIPSDVKELDNIVSIKYNKRKESDTRDRYDTVEYIYPDKFLDLTNDRVSSANDITVVTDFGGAILLIKNDTAPTYWTSFDDDYIVFDSYDAAIDNTLQNSKTQVVAYKQLEFSFTDSFIPDMPAEAFPALFNEAKSVAFIELKQQANDKAEQVAQRQKRWLSRQAWRASGGVRYPNFGRNRQFNSMFPKTNFKD